MKKLLYTFLAVSLIFSACEEDTPAPSANNGSNSTGTISNVVGIWHFLGRYDALGNLNSMTPAEATCILQGTITLDSLGNGVWTEYYLSNSGTGPCLSQSQVFSFNYISSTTLEFIMASSCGNPTVTLPIPTQFQIPSCNGDNGTLDGGYLLFEL